MAVGVDRDGLLHRSLARSIEGSHVPDVYALHLSDDFETFEAGGLVDVCGDCSDWGSWGEEVVLVFDFWEG